MNSSDRENAITNYKKALELKDTDAGLSVAVLEEQDERKIADAFSDYKTTIEIALSENNIKNIALALKQLVNFKKSTDFSSEDNEKFVSIVFLMTEKMENDLLREQFQILIKETNFIDLVSEDAASQLFESLKKYDSYHIQFIKLARDYYHNKKNAEKENEYVFLFEVASSMISIRLLLSIAKGNKLEENGAKYVLILQAINHLIEKMVGNLNKQQLEQCISDLLENCSKENIAVQLLQKQAIQFLEAKLKEKKDIEEASDFLLKLYSNLLVSPNYLLIKNNKITGNEERKEEVEENIADLKKQKQQILNAKQYKEEKNESMVKSFAKMNWLPAVYDFACILRKEKHFSGNSYVRRPLCFFAAASLLASNEEMAEKIFNIKKEEVSKIKSVSDEYIHKIADKTLKEAKDEKSEEYQYKKLAEFFKNLIAETSQSTKLISDPVAFMLSKLPPRIEGEPNDIENNIISGFKQEFGRAWVREQQNLANTMKKEMPLYYGEPVLQQENRVVPVKKEANPLPLLPQSASVSYLGTPSQTVLTPMLPMFTPVIIQNNIAAQNKLEVKNLSVQVPGGLAFIPSAPPLSTPSPNEKAIVDLGVSSQAGLWAEKDRVREVEKKKLVSEKEKAVEKKVVLI